MCFGSSMGISTDSKPHFLNVRNRRVLSLVNGEVKRNVLMPNLMPEIFSETRPAGQSVKSKFFEETKPQMDTDEHRWGNRMAAFDASYLCSSASICGFSSRSSFHPALRLHFEARQ